MPLYDYSCKKCDRKWEASHSIEERKDEYCCSLTANLLISGTRGKPIILEGYNQGIGLFEFINKIPVQVIPVNICD